MKGNTMNRKIILMYVLLTMMLCLTGISTRADNVIIDTSGAMPFLYDGHSYIPLKSTASFIGAPLQWDTAKHNTIMTYNNDDLVLTPNSLNALFAGKPIVLLSPPVIVGGVTYIPASTLKKYYNIPVTWDGTRSEVKIKGLNGWGTMKASKRPPWRHNGPPPWAPAWGVRGHGTPGHQNDGKVYGHKKIKANKPALMQRKYSTQDHPNIGKVNNNKKVKGNKKNK